MGDRYVVVTRSDGFRTWHVVHDGPLTGRPIDPGRIVIEFKDRSKAESHAAMLNRTRASVELRDDAPPPASGAAGRRPPSSPGGWWPMRSRSAFKPEGERGDDAPTWDGVSHPFGDS